MPVAVRSITRLQDADDFGSTPGAGNDGYSITWNNSTSRFVLTSVSGGSVSSVFGRTGAVVAASGDYTAAQVTNAAAVNAANTFTAAQSIIASSETLFAVESATNPRTLIVDTTNDRVGVNLGTGLPSVTFQVCGRTQISDDSITPGRGFVIQSPGAQQVQMEMTNSGSGGHTLRFLTAGWNDDKLIFGTNSSKPFIYATNFLVGLGHAPTSPAAACHALTNDAVTNAVTNIGILAHNSTGTPAAGFGAGLKFTLESSTTADQDAARLVALWDVATHASRSAALKILISNTAEVDAAQFDDDATAGNTRFLVYDVDNAQLERVSVGAADSGGVGFKLLRISN